MTTTLSHLSDRTAAFINTPLLRHRIGGAWQESRDGRTIDVIDPARGEPLTTVAMGAQPEIDAAVHAAHEAFPAWSGLTPRERAVLLHRLADKLEEHAEALAEIESLDVGKTIVNAESFDVPFGIACLRYFADLAVHASYSTPLAIKQIDARIHRTPYGACGFIFPWNFPFDLLMWGIAPALAAGNTVVVKPSEITPLSTLYVARLAEEVHLPAGILNVVVGGPDAGAALPMNPKVRRMSFTGSPEVGKRVGAACGGRPIPCKLELGGKGAAVVLDDVDVKATAQALAAAITLNSGQVCCTATRWIVHEKVYDELIHEAAATLQATKIGPGLDRNTQMGPLVSAIQRDRVLSYLDRGKRDGAHVILDGGPEHIDGHNGYYVKPYLLEGAETNVCFREEIFGPAAFCTRFRDENDALRQANSLDYGLANSVWSNDLSRANRLAGRLVAGNSWINAHNVFAYGLPYGGVNLSGMGGGVNSPETFYDYLRSQTIARPLG